MLLTLSLGAAGDEIEMISYSRTIRKLQAFAINNGQDVQVIIHKENFVIFICVYS